MYGISSQDLVEVAGKPLLVARSPQPECRVGEASAEGELDVVRQIWWRCGSSESYGVALGQDSEWTRGGGGAGDLAFGQSVHVETDQSPGPRPGRRVEVSADASCQEETPGSAVVVHRPFDGPQQLRNLLPLVEEHRPVERRERGVGIRVERSRLGRAVEANDARCVLARRGRLPRGTRTNDETAGCTRRTSASSSSRSRRT